MNTTSSALSLSGKKVAILTADGFEQSELLQPRAALDAAGATTVIVSPNQQYVKSWTGEGFGPAIAVDVQ
ncbi:MAG: DJ-1/PfpI family protein, partial [Burkholderiales bacterium]|nr:DJ-1/PfpI family protein [Opitutaceae bacterium]